MAKKISKDSNLANRVIFLQALLTRARAERSNYSRLLFQENVIALSVVATLQTISLLINERLQVMSFSSRKIELKKPLEITFSDKDFEKKTLGQLATILYPYLTQENALRSELKKFVKIRNRLTHNMFDEYENIADLEKDSGNIVKVGERVVKGLGHFRNKLQTSLIREKA